MFSIGIEADNSGDIGVALLLLAGWVDESLRRLQSELDYTGCCYCCRILITSGVAVWISLSLDLNTDVCDNQCHAK